MSNNLFGKKIAFHVHTKHSIDSYLDPSVIVDHYVRNKYDVVVITDHNEILGAVAAKKYAQNKYGNLIEIIVGEEISTDYGDIIGFPLIQKIEPNNFYSVCNEIKMQNAYVCLPHPYAEHNLLMIHNKEVTSILDFVEVFNCRVLNDKFNQYGSEYAQTYNIKEILGVDAHIKKELGLCWFVWDEDFNITRSEKRYSNKRHSRSTTIIKSIKNKSYSKLPIYLLLFILGK